MATATRRVAVPRGLAAAGVLGRRTVGELAAVAQIVLAGAVVLATADRRSVLSSPNHGAFTEWFAGPLRGLLPGLTTSQSMLERGLHDALFAMLAAWLLVLLGGSTVRSGVVIGAVVAVNLIYVLCPPFALTDLFNYIGYARLDAVHHLNPYVQIPAAEHGDPVYAYSNWHHLRSPYGPLFTLLLLPVARLPLPVAYWLYKAFSTAASLGLLAVVWACARRLGRPPAAAVAFVGLNPIVLIYELGGKHNDVVMMVCLMGGGLLILMGREARGGAALAAAVAIKASAGLLAPVIALGALSRRRALAGAIGGGLALAAVTLLAFGPHPPNVADQSRLVNLFSVPELIGYAAGHGGADAGVRRIFTVAGLVGGAVCALVAWRTRRWETAGGWAALVALASISWLSAWYVLWVLPFAAISRSRVLRGVTLATTVALVLVKTATVATVLHRHGVDLKGTAVWRANHRFERSLLR